MQRKKRVIAWLLAVLMVLTNIQFYSQAETTEYSTYLNGWTVDIAWSNLSYDYVWDATTDTTKQPKIVVSYRIEKANHAYNAGDIIFQITGIGNANRDSILKASQIAADSDDSEWSYTWDPDTDVYTFTNNFTVAEGESVSGGFEFLWTLDARDTIDGYEQSASPTFSVDGETITLNPLTFSFTSVSDRYDIYWTRTTLSASEYDDYDSDYVWYTMETAFGKTWLARGLYRSSYWISVELPEGSDYSDVIVYYGGEEIELESFTDMDGNTHYGFYLFQNSSDDLGSKDSTYYDTFVIGFKAETLNTEKVTISGHLDRLYDDESEWTTTARDDDENVDVSDTFYVFSYSFHYAGMIYSVDKYNSTYEISLTHEPPLIYEKRLNVMNIYSGKVVQFILYGRANRDYSSASNGSLTSTASYSLRSVASASDADHVTLASSSNATRSSDDEPEGEIVEDGEVQADDWNDINWSENGLYNPVELTGMTYEEVLTASSSDAEPEYNDDGDNVTDATFFDFTSAFTGLKSAFTKNLSLTANADTTTKPGGNTGASKIGENEEYALILGDDKLAIVTNSYGLRELENDEYDIAYVTVPADSYQYDYEIYGSEDQDTHFDDYQILATGNTGTKQTFQFEDGVKAVFVKVTGITGSYYYNAYVGVRLHLDWEKDQERDYEDQVDPEQYVVNFDYLRSVYLEENTEEEDSWYEVNDCAVTESKYEGDYADCLAERDIDLYQEYLYRDFSRVWLRSSITKLTASTTLDSFDGNGKTGFTSSVTSSGTIQADDAGELTSFSLYSVLPDGLEEAIDESGITINGSATTIDGSIITNLDDYATISIGEYNGQTVVIVDFDFSSNPLDITSLTSISMNYDVTLSFADYLIYGNSYTVWTYLIVNDAGIDKVSGTAIVADTYDIDEDGNTTEKMAYASGTETCYDNANEWREYVSKYVKSEYSSGYVADTVVRLYNVNDEEEDQEKSYYSYRLDFGLGAAYAKNIIFYDSLEQGASLYVNEDDPDSQYSVESEWQGNLVSIDTSYAEKIGMEVTVYYSTEADLVANEVYDLTDERWTTEEPEDLSTVKSIAIALDTSGMEDGFMKSGQMVYVIINMRATSDADNIDKQAVNQYTIVYDAYSLTGSSDKTYTLSSAETYVTVLETVGKAILQKVDGDNVTKMDSDGNATAWSSLTGATFNIYQYNEEDPDNPTLLYENVSVNSLARIVLNNISYGTYYYEEVETPAGYQTIEGLQEFKISGDTGTVYIKNSRIPGSVTLTKIDVDSEDSTTLAGAVYELYKSDGTQIFTDDNYAYSETGTNGEFTTGEDGTFTVTNLPWASYYFVEVSAPTGYEMNTSEINFTISKSLYDEESNTIHTEVTGKDNERTASLLLIKTDEENGAWIQGAVYSLYQVSSDGEDTLISSGLKTNAVGEIEVKNLKFGTYYFVETRNATGYKMPTGDDAITDSVELNAETTGQIVEIEHTNERRKGSVNLIKYDDAGSLVGGATYDLYRKGEEDTDYVWYGTYTTESDKTADDYAEITVEDLTWADYYFVETAAPTGYDVSDEHIEFTINKDTVTNTIYLETTDYRTKGTIVLKKVDKEDNSITLSGAVYELYKTDGTLCVLDTDYTLDDDLETITTGDDGTITISNLTQGGYYLKEITAPNNYTLSSDYVRFSITKENASVVQEIIAEDEAGKAVITIEKTVDSAYESFGNPTFNFKITKNGTDEVSYVSITLSEDNPSGKTTLTVEKGYTYTVEEIGASRYEFIKVTSEDDNVSISNHSEPTATADLDGYESAEISFTNNLDDWEEYSHTSNATNIVKKAKKLTAISAVWNGDNPIDEDTEGYDSTYEWYLIDKDLLTVTAYYDDGTYEILESKDFTVSPDTAYGESESYTGTVSYTESGITRTASFQLDIDLPDTLNRYTITYVLYDGTLEVDGDYLSSYSFKIKEGRTISRPETDPVKDGYTFMGWYSDETFENEIFVYDEETETYADLTITGDTTIYAYFKQDGVKVKYAVTIYGIQEDTDENGNTVGLTFGPATGVSYINSSNYHISKTSYNNGEGICLHWMTWNEIIAQSKEDPTVFADCLENGCTHSVELTITGTLADGATSYPNISGDGAGMLYNSLNSDYSKWNLSSSNTGGWRESRIRAMLNGVDTSYTADGKHNDSDVAGTDMADFTESNALISMFPDELQDSIVSKQVESDTVYNSKTNGKHATTYDKLWLFSTSELYASGSYSLYRSNYEGTLYTRQDSSHLNISSDNYDDMINYDESESSYSWWLSSLSAGGSANAVCVGMVGSANSSYTSISRGVAPGFCLPGPEPATTFYAVTLYGIQEDTYSEDGGATTYTAGLTFGPATGASYWDSYVRCSDKGVSKSEKTSLGNAYRCIHDDNWATIAEWSQKDPHVYDYCIATSTYAGCTKSVPLTISDEIVGTKYTGASKPSGDGTGELCESLNSSYRMWNNSEKNTGGWRASRIRAVLNGVDTSWTDTSVAGTDMTISEFADSYALINAFPEALKSIIVPKQVESDISYDSKTEENQAITYDKLWLFSTSELYASGSYTSYRSNYEGKLYTRQDSSHLALSNSNRSAIVNYPEEADASANSWWLRSLRSDYSNTAVNVFKDGTTSNNNTNNKTIGIAPGFCLPGQN